MTDTLLNVMSHFGKAGRRIVVGVIVSVAIILAAINLTPPKPPSNLDLLSSDCPIVWGAYTLGTNHTLYLRHGRPMDSQRYGRALAWLDSAVRRMFNRTLFEVTSYSASMSRSALFLYVRIKKEPPSGSHPNLRPYLIDPTGKRTPFSPYKAIYREWTMYLLEMPPNPIDGCMVEFIEFDSKEAVARLKL